MTTVPQQKERPSTDPGKAALEEPVQEQPGPRKERSGGGQQAVWSLRKAGRGMGGMLRQQTVTLSVENGLVRVVVFRGREIVVWGSASPAEMDPDSLGLPGHDDASAEGTPWPPGEQALPDEAIAAGLRDLLKELDVRRGRLVMDFPAYEALIRYLRIPKVSGRYLEQVVTSEILDSIPFTAGEVDITWHLQRTRSGHDVYAVAVPKEKIDDRVRLVKQAGVAPRAIYSKAEALAFAAGVPNAVVIHLEQSQASIVLVHDHLPRVVHQLEMPPDLGAPEEQADALAMAVAQVAGYTAGPQQTFGVSDEAESVPVLLTGELSEETDVALVLSEVLHRPVLPFTPDLNYPKHFLPHEYAVNLGLFLADQSRVPKGARAKQASASHNLLPERHLPRPLPVQPIAVFVVLVLFGAVAVSATGQVNTQVEHANVLSRQSAALESQVAQYRLTQANERAVSGRFEAASQQTLALQSHLEGLQFEMDTLLARLETITRDALPPTVRVASIAPQADGFALSGSADSYEAALQYTANLRASGFFADARVLRADAGSQGGGRSVSFQVRITVP